MQAVPIWERQKIAMNEKISLGKTESPSSDTCNVCQINLQT